MVSDEAVASADDAASVAGDVVSSATGSVLLGAANAKPGFLPTAPKENPVEVLSPVDPKEKPLLGFSLDDELPLPKGKEDEDVAPNEKVGAGLAAGTDAEPNEKPGLDVSVVDLADVVPNENAGFGASVVDLAVSKEKLGFDVSAGLADSKEKLDFGASTGVVEPNEKLGFVASAGLAVPSDMEGVDVLLSFVLADTEAAGVVDPTKAGLAVFTEVDSVGTGGVASVETEEGGSAMACGADISKA